MINVFDVLNNIALFNCLTAEELDIVSARFKQVSYSAGSVILEQDSIGDNFYVLVSGKVTVAKRLPAIFESQNAEIYVFPPYSYFGEMALLNNCPRPTSCIATTDCELLLLDKESFHQLCHQNPHFLITLIKANSRRIALSNRIYTDTIDETIRKNRLLDIGTATSKIVHDIQMPISVIILTAEFIQQKYGETAEHTRKIIKHANMMTEFVREILDFARGEKSLLNLSDCDLNTLFADIEETVVPIAEIKKIKVYIDNDITHYIRIDINKIKRTIINIVKNSIEAIPEHSEIRLTSRLIGDKWHFTFRDNGLGIPPEIVQNIFEPFYTKGKEHGTGLGLAICKKIIDDHKGTITLDNHPDGGVVVEIEIPV